MLRDESWVDEAERSRGCWRLRTRGAPRSPRRDAFSLSVARLQQASSAAVGTLLRIMTDREAPAASRVRAADVVLQIAMRGIEMEDLDARLAIRASGGTNRKCDRRGCSRGPMTKSLDKRVGRLEATAVLSTAAGIDTPDLRSHSEASVGVIQQIRSLNARTLDLLSRAGSLGRSDTVLRAIREVRANIELLARLTGELDEKPIRFPSIVMLPATSEDEPTLTLDVEPYPWRYITSDKKKRKLNLRKTGQNPRQSLDCRRVHPPAP